MYGTQQAEWQLKFIFSGPTARQQKAVNAADARAPQNFLALYRAGKARARNAAHKAQLDAELEAGGGK